MKIPELDLITVVVGSIQVHLNHKTLANKEVSSFFLVGYVL